MFWDAVTVWLVWHVVMPLVGILVILAVVVAVALLTSKKDKPQ